MFPESCFNLGNVKLTLTCFQMWFVDSLKLSNQMLQRSQKRKSKFFDVNLPKELSFRKKTVFDIVQMFNCNEVWFLGSISPFYQKINSMQRL